MALTEGITSPELGKRTRTKTVVLSCDCGDWTSPLVVFSCRRRHRVRVRYPRGLSKKKDRPNNSERIDHVFLVVQAILTWRSK